MVKTLLLNQNFNPLFIWVAYDILSIAINIPDGDHFTKFMNSSPSTPWVKLWVPDVPHI